MVSFRDVEDPDGRQVDREVRNVQRTKRIRPAVSIRVSDDRSQRIGISKHASPDFRINNHGIGRLRVRFPNLRPVHEERHAQVVRIIVIDVCPDNNPASRRHIA